MPCFGKSDEKFDRSKYLNKDEQALYMKRISAWPYFVISWWKHRNDANVLWLHYEDLKASSSGAVYFTSVEILQIT